MARRSSDRPTTVPGAVKDASSRLEELHRQQGRGAPALRGRGQVIEVASASGRPMLNPRGVDTALRFDDNGATVVGTDGSSPRDWTVRNLTVTGEVRVTGGVFADGDGIFQGNGFYGGTLRSVGRFDAGEVWSEAGIRAGAGISAAGNISRDGGFIMGITPQSDPTLYTPTDDASVVSYAGAIYISNNANTQRRNLIALNVASERSLKDGTDLDGGDALEVVRQWRAARYRWKPGTPYDDGGEHAAVYVDEIADTAPEVVAGTDRDGYRIPDVRGEVAYLVAAVQRLADENAALRRRLDALENDGPRPVGQ